MLLGIRPVLKLIPGAFLSVEKCELLVLFSGLGGLFWFDLFHEGDESICDLLVIKSFLSVDNVRVTRQSVKSDSNTCGR